MQRDTKIGIAIGVLLVALVVIFWWAQQEENTLRVPPAEERPVAVEGITEPPTAPTGGSDAGIDPAAVDMADVLGRAAERLEDKTGAAEGSGDEAVGSDGSQEGGVAGSGATPPAGEVKARTHVVRSGETLTGIAKEYYGAGASWRRIYEANRAVIPDPDRLGVGMKLTIPGVAAEVGSPATGTGSGGTETARGARRHTVRSGESLRSIAKRYYGAEGGWRRIHEANRGRIGEDPRRLKIGVTLIIPAAPE